MSWFKRHGSMKGEVQATAAPMHKHAPPTALPSSGSVVGRPRSGTDPDTCLEVFKSHWLQAVTIMNKTNMASAGVKRTSLTEEVNAISQHLDQMMMLLVEEEGSDGNGQGPVLQYLLCEDILEKILTWSNRVGEHMDRLRLTQLKTYDMLISQANQLLLIHKPVIRPLMKLLAACADHPNNAMETHIILLLHQLCVCVTKNAHILELLFSASSDHGPARFLMFSLLIPYVHREGVIGQQARDALLLIMALSARHERIGLYIANNSDFCPVLATGLSGLYSSLPRKLNIPADDWYRLSEEDILNMPDLVMFLNSLEFCNAVVQVAHPLVQKQLLTFIYNGFLVPVIGPALHQNEFVVSTDYTPVESDHYESFNIDDPFELSSSDEDAADDETDDDDDVEEVADWQSSMEEVIAATGYLELFIRRITEPAMMKTFLRFLLTEKHDDVFILDSLVARINSNSRLCMVSLSLFHTLLELNSEDTMFQLVFKYLIPCTHVMVSQRRCVRDLDLYSKTAEKFLSLKPACCIPDVSDSPPEGPSTPNPPESPSSSSSRSSSPDVTTQSGGTKLEHFETNYMEYLASAREKIQQCTKACTSWSAPYDGDNPSSDSLIVDSPGDDGTLPDLDMTPVTEKNLDSVFPDTPTAGQPEEKGKSMLATNDNVITSEVPKSEDDISNLPNSSDASRIVSQKENYAESVTSEADSALSGSSSHTDTVSHPENIASGSDSPLNDNFDPSDFNTFLLSLKRVKTPVEFCDDIEDSFHEIDELVNDLKRSSVCPSLPFGQPPSSELPSFTAELKCSRSDIVKPEPSHTEPLTPSSSKNVLPNAESSQLPVEIQNAEADIAQRKLAEDVAHIVATSSVSLEGPDTPKRLGLTTSLFMPSKYALGIPNIGPFLTALLNKLETMMQNSLYVNMLLTGILSRLACYPQPLIRSFLLNHSLVFQPSVKSLVQVLGSVKHKVDCYSYTVKDFESLLLRARRFLAWREEVFYGVESGGRVRSDSTISLPPTLSSKPQEPQRVLERKRGGSVLGDFLFGRNKPSGRGRGKDSRLQVLQDGRGVRYVNKTQQQPPEAQDKMESIKTKNAVYCALVLEEFLKELAAISQEHSVLHSDEGYSSVSSVS